MREKFLKYEEYKSTNEGWIKEIPPNWEMIKAKYLFAERVEKGHSEKPLLAATQSQGVIKKKDYATRTVTAQKDFHLLKLVKVGDFVISLRSFQGGIEISYEEGIISPAYTILNLSKKHSKDYYKHLLKSKFFILSLNRFVTGIREGQNIDYSKFKNSFLPLPPPTQQKAIADFLDQKTVEIDNYIRLKEKTIKLLEERKAAVINQAVTKGLDPMVKMKDSGIEWMGEIPAHWEVLRLGHYTDIVRGSSPRPAGDPSLFSGTFMPWITVKSVTSPKGKYLTETDTFLTEKGAKQSRTVYPETLLLSNSGATLGIPRILKIKGCINDGSVAFESIRGNIERDFLYYFLQTLTKRLKEEQEGYGQPNLNTSIISNIRVSVPPNNEQIEIINFLDKRIADTSILIVRETENIRIIKEYRESLISAAVTGKIDVRNYHLTPEKYVETTNH